MGFQFLEAVDQTRPFHGDVTSSLFPNMLIDDNRGMGEKRIK